MSLSTIDLNLLTVFRAIDDTRHVTKAAKVLGVSQPALSHALARLRETFGDALFVKTPKGVTPTPRALTLAGPIRAALDAIERDVLDRGTFSPKSLTRTFQLRTTDFLEALYATPLLKALEHSAPGVRFASAPLGFELPKDALESGTCDLAIAGFFGELGPSYRAMHLFDDTYACAVRKGHPRIGARGAAPWTLDAYCKERHVLVAPSGELTGTVDRVLREQRPRTRAHAHAHAQKNEHRPTRSVIAGASGFMVAGWMAAESDSVLTAPRRLLALLATRLPLRVVDVPLKMPKISVVAVWHARNDADPGHRWFRELVHRSVA